MSESASELSNVALQKPTARRFAFLLYDSRSGSTLFAALLNRYRDVAVSLESSFVARMIEYPHPLITTHQVQHLVDHLFAEVQFREWGLTRNEVEGCVVGLGDRRSKQEVVHSLLHLYFTKRDDTAGMCVLKSSAFHHIRLLRAWYPDALFVHIVRDGRAVYCSKRSSRSVNGRPMQRNLIKAALDWRRNVRTAQKFSECVATVRFEDLVRDPDHVLAHVLNLLEVPPAGRVTTKHQGDYHRQIGAAQAHLHPNAGKPPQHDRTDHWRNVLSVREVALYEKIAGRELRLHGYQAALSPAPLDLLNLQTIRSTAEFVGDRFVNLGYAIAAGRVSEKLGRRKARWLNTVD
jgi:hypothetical protein